jgi:hypothetical protein
MLFFDDEARNKEVESLGYVLLLLLQLSNLADEGVG